MSDQMWWIDVRRVMADPASRRAVIGRAVTFTFVGTAAPVLDRIFFASAPVRPSILHALGVFACACPIIILTIALDVARPGRTRPAWARTARLWITTLVLAGLLFFVILA